MQVRQITNCSSRRTSKFDYKFSLSYALTVSKAPSVGLFFPNDLRHENLNRRKQKRPDATRTKMVLHYPQKVRRWFKISDCFHLKVQTPAVEMFACLPSGENLISSRTRLCPSVENRYRKWIPHPECEREREREISGYLCEHASRVCSKWQVYFYTNSFLIATTNWHKTKNMWSVMLMRGTRLY